MPLYKHVCNICYTLVVKGHTCSMDVTNKKTFALIFQNEIIRMTCLLLIFVLIFILKIIVVPLLCNVNNINYNPYLHTYHFYVKNYYLISLRFRKLNNILFSCGF